MKKITGLTTLCVIAGVFLLSCALGADPAWQAGSTVVLELGDGAEGERAVAQGGGVLYIQDSVGRGAKLYGPYLPSGSSFVITDLQAGFYPEIFLIYAPQVIDFNVPPVISAGNAADELFTAINNPSLARGTTLARVAALQVKSGQSTTLRTTLLPITDLEISVPTISGVAYAAEDFSGYGLLPVTGSASQEERVFIKLNGVGSDLEAGQLIDFLHCIVENDGVVAVSVGAIGLYKADGRRIFSSQVNDVLEVGDDAEAGVPYFSGSEYFLYIEYKAASLEVRFGAVLVEE